MSIKSYTGEPKTIISTQVTSITMGSVWNQKSSQQELEDIISIYKPNGVTLESKSEKREKVAKYL